jgi:ABC-type nitrate/sulfonate/bicarbonate transport system ATPase subunit
MSGTDFVAPTRREGPDQVSESQREFIDLAFRMALIEQAGSGSTGSMVMDAPESSLDAIFVRRAVTVLGKFGNHRKKNRLIIASNLVEGELIPELVALTASEKQIVNMFEIATPTAAVRENKRQYNNIMRRLTSRRTSS